MNTEFTTGVKDGLPIALGYAGVSFSFGIMASSVGISPQLAGLISLTNLTSAGQFAGLNMIVAQASYFEVFLTQFIINLRYGLMSLSLSQKLSKECTTGKRMLFAFANTDEIFAVASSRKGEVTPSYMFGLESTPILAWTGGTILGAAANNLLPASLQSALGVALYGMFVAIVLPCAREQKSITIVVLIALILRCLLAFVPGLQQISSGFAVIICTVLAAGIGAALFPIEEEEA